MSRSKPRPRVFIASSSEGLDVAKEIQRELEKDVLATVWDQAFFTPSRSAVATLTAERVKEFDQQFTELARKVYFTSDRRSDVKKKLNLHLGSQIIEEKSYQDYS